jgi:hypothetical protein
MPIMEPLDCFGHGHRNFCVMAAFCALRAIEMDIQSNFPSAMKARG